MSQAPLAYGSPAAGRRPRASRVFTRLAAGLAPLLLACALWQVTAVVVRTARGVPFPGPVDAVARLLELLGGTRILEHRIYRHLWDSICRWAMGFGSAAVCGLVFGLAAGWWRSLGRLTVPLVHMLQLIPGLAWIPVALLVFGVGQKATVFMIAMTAFSPIAISVVSGVKQVDETYVRAARMMAADGPALFLRVLVPGALPHILNGLRIGLGNGWRVLVAGEMVVGTGTGLGYAIIQARWTLDYPTAFACLLIICLVGLAVERLVFRPIERRTIERWGLRRGEWES